MSLEHLCCALIRVKVDVVLMQQHRLSWSLSKCISLPCYDACERLMRIARPGADRLLTGCQILSCTSRPTAERRRSFKVDGIAGILHILCCDHDCQQADKGLQRIISRSSSLFSMDKLTL